MLPDYPKLKKDLQEALDRYLRERVAAYMGIVGQFPHCTVHEGDRTYLQRAAGDSAETEFTLVDVTRSLSRDELPRLTLDDILARLDEGAGELAGRTKQHAFGEMDRIVTDAGQVVSGKGQPLPETILQTFEKLEIDFDGDGKISGLKVICHPSQQAALVEAFRRLEEDPAYKARFDEVLQRQRERWRARETGRNLVG